MSKISVRKHRKSWMYDVHHPSIGRKRKYGFRTRAAANQAALEFMKGADDGLLQDESITFVNYYKTWLKVNKANAVSRKQLSWYYRTLDLFIEKYGAHKLLSTVTKNDIQLLLNEYGEGRTRESVRKVKNCLVAPLREALYEGYIKRDPTYKLQTLASKPAQKPQDKFLSLTEYLQLIEFFKSKQHKSYILLLLIALTGARFSEVNNMTIKDLNYKLDSIWLPGTKTETSAREVSIEREVLDDIRAAVKAQPLKYNGKIFDISNRAVTKTYQLGLQTIGSDSKTTVYALRHTHASFLINNNFDITYVSRRLGHSNPNTTLKVYSHLLKEKEEEQNKKLATIWRQST